MKTKFINVLLIALLLVANNSLAVNNSNHKTNASQKKQKQKQQKQRRIKAIVSPVDEDAWVANVETAVYRVGTFENISMGYSSANGWDVSLSLVNTQVLGANQHFQGDTFVNVAKTFDINHDWSLTLGSQNGVALSNPHPRLWYSYSYLDVHYQISSWLSLHTGTYLANKALTGTVQQVGVLTGTEVVFIPHTLALQLDYVSGHQALSGATANLQYTVDPHCQLYFGVAVPEQHSGNEFAGIIGVNLSTKDF